MIRFKFFDFFKIDLIIETYKTQINLAVTRLDLNFFTQIFRII